MKKSLVKENTLLHNVLAMTNNNTVCWPKGKLKIKKYNHHLIFLLFVFGLSKVSVTLIKGKHTLHASTK